MKKGPKDLLDGLSKLKTLNQLNDRLPYYYDMMWDIKYVRQLLSYLVNNDDNNVYSRLAVDGFDVKAIKDTIEFNRETLKSDMDSGIFYDDQYTLPFSL